MNDGPRYLMATDLQGLGLTIDRVADVLEEAFRHKAAGRVVSPPIICHNDPCVTALAPSQ
jgi:hypothetical protein